MAVQVYTATHDGEGNSLPIMKRQFISFSWGGKKIEDFNLLITFNNDGLERQLTSNFSDTTTQYDGVDGALYWMTTLNPTTISFTLASDGMTSRDLENFKSWFRPGETRELVLTEYPTRAIQARLSSPPNLSMVPFKNEQSFKINGTSTTVITTMYRGTISIEFAMDNPAWYSIIGLYDGLSGESSQAYKNIPFGTTILPSAASSAQINVETGAGLQDAYMTSLPVKNQLKSTCWLGGGWYYKISGGTSTLEANPSGITYEPDDSDPAGYLYYCGTAKSKPICSFSGSVIVDDDTDYITFPKNNTYAGNGVSWIKIGEQTFAYTTPSYLASYNECVYIMKNSEGKSVIETAQLLRETLSNAIMKIAAIGALNDAADGAISITSTIISDVIDAMKSYLPYGNNKYFTMTFNSETGAADITYVLGLNVINESCGDCVKTDYLIISDANSPDSNGEIDTSELTPISVSDTINNFKINYVYKFL